MEALIIENNTGMGQFSRKVSDNKFLVIASLVAVMLNFLNKNLSIKKSSSFKVMLSILMLFFISVTIAQNFQDTKKKYRVTAFQKGKNQVFSLSNEVEIMPAAIYYIPNAFTPNGDGLNETFGLVGQGITDYEIQIFNRWGNLIFESNDLERQWDGNYHNEKAPMGVYVYKITGKGPIGEGKIQRLINENGIVTLVL